MKVEPKDYMRIIPAPPVVLVSTLHGGVKNLAPFGMNMPISFDPPLYAIGMRTTRDTYENILENREFVVAVPDPKLVKEIDITAQSFPSNVSEFEKANLTPARSEVVKPLRVKECQANFECKLEWTKQAGDFASNPTNSVWTNAPAGGVTNREFQLRAWFDCDTDNAYTNTEPHRIIDVVVVNLEKLILSNTFCDGWVEDLTLTDESASSNNTLVLCESTNGTAEMAIEAEWLPTNVHSNRFMWEILLSGGSVGATQWNSTNGTFQTNPTNVVWTNSASGGVTNREFLVRAWYDCDKDNKYDSHEPHRSLYVTVIKIYNIAVKRTHPLRSITNAVLVTGDSFQGTVTNLPGSRTLLWTAEISNNDTSSPIFLAHMNVITNNVYTNKVTAAGKGGKIFLYARDSENECCWERKVINFCKSKEFNVTGLKERFLSPRPTWPPD